MRVGDEVRTAVALPGIATGTRGSIKEIGRLFVVVAFPDGRQGYYARRQLAPLLSGQDDDLSSAPSLVPLGVANARLPRGSHGCLLSCGDNEMINTFARYLGAGLETGETAICWFPSKWQDYFLRCLRQLGIGTDSALRERRLIILNPSKVYLKKNEFTTNKQLEITATTVSVLAKEHPKGVRLFGYAGRRFTIDGWWEYEARFTPIAKAFNITTLCGYPDLSGSALHSRLAVESHNYFIKHGQVLAGGQDIGG